MWRYVYFEFLSPFFVVSYHFVACTRLIYPLHLRGDKSWATYLVDIRSDWLTQRDMIFLLFYTFFPLSNFAVEKKNIRIRGTTNCLSLFLSTLSQRWLSLLWWCFVSDYFRFVKEHNFGKLSISLKHEWGFVYCWDVIWFTLSSQWFRKLFLVNFLRAL